MFSDIVNYITFDMDQIIGEGGVILTGTRPAFEYRDGVRTTQRCGTRVLGVAPSRGYMPVAVLVKEEIDINPDEIDSGDPVKVSFVGFRAKLYRPRGADDYAISCKADSVVLLEDKPKAKEVNKSA